MSNKILIWSWKHLPGAAWLFFRCWRPICNFILSSLEAPFWWSKRKDAQEVLKALRVEGTPKTLLQWYQEVEFKWRQDPLKGFLDFSSKPWVSIARHAGDCDDMMVIAESVLKGRYSEVGYKASIKRDDGRGHAIYVVLSDDNWRVFSNTVSVSGFTSLADALKWFYGDRTIYAYAIGVGRVL